MSQENKSRAEKAVTKYRRFMEQQGTRNFRLRGGGIKVVLHNSQSDDYKWRALFYSVGLPKGEGFSGWAKGRGRKEFFRSLRFSISRKDPKILAVTARVKGFEVRAVGTSSGRFA